MYKVITNLITPNQWSRPQHTLEKIKAIVLHWVANANSTAIGNRNYFDNKKYGKDDYGSAHEIIDLNGDVVVCIPSNEISYNCGSKTYTQRCLNELGDSPNYCTYGIECTHINWDGVFTEATYKTMVERCADLCKKFNLNPLKDLWTHQEVVGWKDCPRWFVNNPNEWKFFKEQVKELIENPNMIIKYSMSGKLEVNVVEILKKGSYGAAVGELQKKLNLVGYNLIADNDFGGLTDNAVRTFQSNYGLLVDGIVGSMTIAALDKAIADLQKPIDKTEYNKLKEDYDDLLLKYNKLHNDYLDVESDLSNLKKEILVSIDKY